MFDGNFRTGVDRVIAPMGRSLHKAGISPNLITAAGVAMAGACGVAIALEQYPLAVLLLALTGLPDALDGAVAKAGGQAGPRGAYLDSVSDRLSDGLLFAGAGWNLVNSANPRMAMLPFALYLSASLVSYQRAKAESLGFEAKGGLMERAERFLALGFGLLFSSLFVATLWVMLVLTTFTAVTRFVKVWRQANGQPVAVRPVRRNRRRSSRPVADIRARAQARAEARRRNRQG